MATLRRRGLDVDSDDDIDAGSTLERITETIKKLDIYEKINVEAVPEESVERTSQGAALSIICGVLMFLLFVSEFWAFLSVDQREHMVVDTRRLDKMQINIDITFPSLPCALVSMDVMDVTGEAQTNVRGQLKVTRIRNGKEIPTNQHETGGMLRAKQMHNEGCRARGSFTVNRLAGNFHVALGRAHSRFGHQHQFMISDMVNFNATHQINHLSFGPMYPNQVNPLDGVVGGSPTSGGVAHYQYFIKVVPTEYVHGIWRSSMFTNQFSVTEKVHPISVAALQQSSGHRHVKVPGVFFVYDISPFMVQVEARYMSLSEFITRLCAIIGGVFTVFTLLDSLLYHGGNAIFGKQQQFR